MSCFPVVLFVPGWHGSGPKHWQTLWQQRFANSLCAEQADWEKPDCKSWTAQLDADIQARESPVLLVGHSLGCWTVANWASAVSDTHNVVGALLVSPPGLEFARKAPPEIREFASVHGVCLPFPSTLAASRTDPYLRPPEALEIGEAWGSSIFDAGDAGHINVASGHGPWPEGEALLREMLERC